MKTILILRCPEHGEFEVQIERKPHMEFRNMMMSQFENIIEIQRFTGKCPKCGSRIEANINH